MTKEHEMAPASNGDHSRARHMRAKVLQMRPTNGLLIIERRSKSRAPERINRMPVRILVFH